MLNAKGITTINKIKTPRRLRGVFIYSSEGKGATQNRQFVVELKRENKNMQVEKKAHFVCFVL